MLSLQTKGNGCWRIARLLNDEGLGNLLTGRPWHFGTVRGILATAQRYARG